MPPISFSELEIASALQLSHEEFNAHEDRRSATYAGSYVAEQIGVEGLRDLAQRAIEGGHETIPIPWIIEALTEAERSR